LLRGTPHLLKNQTLSAIPPAKTWLRIIGNQESLRATRSATSTSIAGQSFAKQTMRGDIAEVRTEQGKLHMFVAIDRTSKFAFVELHEKATTAVSRAFLLRLIEARRRPAPAARPCR
jgi:hypothetical protein